MKIIKKKHLMKIIKKKHPMKVIKKKHLMKIKKKKHLMKIIKKKHLMKIIKKKHVTSLILADGVLCFASQSLYQIVTEKWSSSYNCLYNCLLEPAYTGNLLVSLMIFYTLFRSRQRVEVLFDCHYL